MEFVRHPRLQVWDIMRHVYLYDYFHKAKPVLRIMGTNGKGWGGGNEVLPIGSEPNDDN